MYSLKEWSAIRTPFIKFICGSGLKENRHCGNSYMHPKGTIILARKTLSLSRAWMELMEKLIV